MESFERHMRRENADHKKVAQPDAPGLSVLRRTESVPVQNTESKSEGEEKKSKVKTPRKMGTKIKKAISPESFKVPTEEQLEDVYAEAEITRQELLRRLDERNSKNGISPTSGLNAESAPETTPSESRESIVSNLDAKKFTPHEVYADNWTDGPNFGKENTYTHPDAPGQVFTQSELSAAEAARGSKREGLQDKPKSVETTSVAGGGGINKTPGQVAGTESAKEPASDEKEYDWTVKRKEFAGLSTKTVREILANEHDAKNFGELVESLDPGGLEIMRKSIANEPLTATERKILNYGRHEYARRLEQIKFINSKITISDLETVGRRDDDFAAALGLDGAARTAELFKKQVLQMGMMDKPALDRLYNTYKNLTELRDTKKYQSWENDVRTLCQKAGTPINEFDTTFDLRDKESRRESQDALAAKFRSSYSPFKKLVDTVIPISQRKAGKLMRKAVRVGDKLKPSRFSPQSFFVRGVDAELANLTEVLKYTISDNPNVIHMIEQEAWQNQNLTDSADNRPRTYTEAQTEKIKAPKVAEDVVKESVEKYRTSDGRDWDHATIVERAEEAARVRKVERAAENSQGTGWFARAMAAIFRSLFSSEFKKAVERPVLAQ